MAVLTPEDLTSHVESKLERKRRRADPSRCDHWGLSGWISEEDVKLDVQLFDWLPRKYIVKLELVEGDGPVRQTGRPSHHTFWPSDRDVSMARAQKPVRAAAFG